MINNILEEIKESIINAAKQLDGVIQVLDSGQTVIPFGKEQETYDLAVDNLRRAVDMLDNYESNNS